MELKMSLKCWGSLAFVVDDLSTTNGRVDQRVYDRSLTRTLITSLRYEGTYARYICCVATNRLRPMPRHPHRHRAVEVQGVGLRITQSLSKLLYSCILEYQP